MTLFGLKFGEEVLKLYGPPPANETKDTRYFLSILGTDYIFKCPNRYAAKGYSQKVDTYMYRFAHLLSYNTFLQNASVPECDDYVCHGTDLPILFNTEYLKYWGKVCNEWMLLCVHSLLLKIIKKLISIKKIDNILFFKLPL